MKGAGSRIWLGWAFVVQIASRFKGAGVWGYSPLNCLDRYRKRKILHSSRSAWWELGDGDWEKINIWWEKWGREMEDTGVGDGRRYPLSTPSYICNEDLESQNIDSKLETYFKLKRNFCRVFSEFLKIPSENGRKAKNLYCRRNPPHPSPTKFPARGCKNSTLNFVDWNAETNFMIVLLWWQ